MCCTKGIIALSDSLKKIKCVEAFYVGLKPVYIMLDEGYDGYIQRIECVKSSQLAQLF
jgi:hypothetical protein